MTSRYRTYRLWQGLISGVALLLLGLALISSSVDLGFVTIPHTPVVGVIFVVAGVLFLTAAVIEYRQRGARAPR